MLDLSLDFSEASHAMLPLLIAAVAFLLTPFSLYGSQPVRPEVPFEPKPEPIRLAIPFDDGFHGCEGAANPFVATGNTALVEDGARPGRVLLMEGHLRENGRPRAAPDKSALIIDPSNLPKDKGTIGFSLQLTGHCSWTDSQRTWLAVLAPDVDYHQDNSTALAVVKERDNTLALWAYQCYDGRHNSSLRGAGYDVADPDQVAIRIPVDHLKKDDWARIRFSWDRAAGRVSLALNEHIESADLQIRPGGFLALLIGTPPSINATPPETRGIEGRIDDLVIDARPLSEAPSAAAVLPPGLPPMAQSASRRREAVFLEGDWPGAAMEMRARTHFDTLVDLQNHGGWAFSYAAPSHLSFVSSKVVVPEGAQYISFSKRSNSAYIAMLLLGAYLTLENPQYIEAAERTAQTLLTLQRDDGSWPYDAAYNQERNQLQQLPKRVGIAGLEDHVQSHPILLLLLLSDLTGKPEYEAAARAGIDFLIKAQNPNGSWSHHWESAENAGFTRQGHRHGGEINDHATQDQMQIMLLAYRKTGNPQYLSAYLRAADWLVESFIDAGAKGWALQYDANNQPVKGRAFEPAAVSVWEGTSSVIQRLIQAWRMTGNPKYLRPLKAWQAWMMQNRVFTNAEKTKWGWHHHYDIESGRPIAPNADAVDFLEPNARPALVGGEIPALLDAISEIESGDPKAQNLKEWQPLDEAAARKMVIEQEGLVAENEGSPRSRFQQPPMNPMTPNFDWDAGTWTKDRWPSGPNINPIAGQPIVLCRSIYLRRQIKGQIPWDGRLAHMRNVWSWMDPFNYVMPEHVLEAPLTNDEIERARAIKTPQI